MVRRKEGLDDDGDDVSSAVMMPFIFMLHLFFPAALTVSSSGVAPSRTPLPLSHHLSSYPPRRRICRACLAPASDSAFLILRRGQGTSGGVPLPLRRALKSPPYGGSLPSKRAGSHAVFLPSVAPVTPSRRSPAFAACSLNLGSSSSLGFQLRPAIWLPPALNATRRGLVSDGLCAASLRRFCDPVRISKAVGSRLNPTQPLSSSVAGVCGFASPPSTGVASSVRGHSSSASARSSSSSVVSACSAPRCFFGCPLPGRRGQPAFFAASSSFAVPPFGLGVSGFISSSAWELHRGRGRREMESPLSRETCADGSFSPLWVAGEWGASFSPASSRPSSPPLSPHASPCSFILAPLVCVASQLGDDEQLRNSPAAAYPARRTLSSSRFASPPSAAGESTPHGPCGAVSPAPPSSSPSFFSAQTASLRPVGGAGGAPAAQAGGVPLPVKSLHFDVVDSTQKWCLRNLGDLCATHGLSPSAWVAVSASRQTAAVGTRDRASLQEKKWVSPSNNVSVTYVIPWPVALASRLLSFAQTASVAVCRVLAEYGLRGQIKWINDVFVDGKKICGILCHNPAFVLPSPGPPAGSPVHHSTVSSSWPSPHSPSTASPPVAGARSRSSAASWALCDDGERYWAVLVGVGINVERKPAAAEMSVKQAVTSMAEELARAGRGGGLRPNGEAGAARKKLEAATPAREPRDFAFHAQTQAFGEEREGFEEREDKERKSDSRGAAGGCPEALDSGGSPSESGLDMHSIRASLDAHMYESFSVLRREGFRALRPFVLSRLAWLGDYVELEDEVCEPSPASSGSVLSPVKFPGSLSAKHLPRESRSHAGGDEEADGEDEVFTDLDGVAESRAFAGGCDASTYPSGWTQSLGTPAGKQGRSLLAAGILQGLDDDGAILIRMTDGRTQKFLGGHLVRP
ncbi:hypothetical protein BESB_020300 [Besnoitia besnoiti]|uniref:Biotin-acetyl-CoA-carboxylase ligase n=1 Tax=Besnoitia besnoiti TaxID=94643 RepID=A0A2A9M298_BESBE|nr:hypothetical protein BESB_020300 [Besnoitia besnoiti]PFH32089.1 hypothetical protein BESB_020300 [Besnoitia besnoiti]